MRCIVCDKCGEIIPNKQQVRTITCSRPVERPVSQTVKREIGQHPPQDTIWHKELCVKCAMEIEALIDTPSEEPLPDDQTPEIPDEIENGGDEL